jgi:hypothetical protein
MRHPNKINSNNSGRQNNFNNSQEQRISIPNLIHQDLENTPENNIVEPSTGQSSSFVSHSDFPNQTLSFMPRVNANSPMSRQRFDNHGLQEHNFYNSYHPGLSPSIYNQSSQFPQYSHVLSGQTPRANISYNQAGEPSGATNSSGIDTSRQRDMYRNW